MCTRNTNPLSSKFTTFFLGWTSPLQKWIATKPIHHNGKTNSNGDKIAVTTMLDCLDACIGIGQRDPFAPGAEKEIHVKQLVSCHELEFRVHDHEESTFRNGTTSADKRIQNVKAEDKEMEKDGWDAALDEKPR